MCAIELTWSKLQYCLRSHNTAGDFSLTRMLQITLEGLSSITAEDWSSYCRHVINIEHGYWQMDSIMEDAVDHIIVNVEACHDTHSNSDGRLDSDGY